jgi:flagellar biogenesis protein FliO
MPRAIRQRWSLRTGLGPTVLLLGIAAAGSAVLVTARAGSGPPDGLSSRSAKALAQVAGTGGAIVGAQDSFEESRGWDDRSRSSKAIFTRRISKVARTERSEGWYLGMAGIAVVLALGGGIAAAARRFAPRGGVGALQVVSRMSLSPKHTVFLVRAGGRVLLIGTGPQGAPALISELDEVPGIEAAPGQGGEA